MNCRDQAPTVTVAESWHCPRGTFLTDVNANIAATEWRTIVIIQADICRVTIQTLEWRTQKETEHSL